MSMLDQAFIKAYRKGATGPAHVGSRHQRGARQRYAADVATYEDPHDPLPAPHINLRTAAAAKPAAPAPAASPVAEPAMAAAKPAVESLRPAFEVPRFVWPPIVDRLISAAFTDFNSLGALLASRSHQNRKTVLISGCREGDGRSTFAMALARVVATRGLRVALVDADFGHPQLGELLGVVVQTAWEDVFAGGESLEEALIESMQERLTLLPLRAAVEHGALVAGQQKLTQSLATLRQAYEVVLIDTGPLDTDAAAIDLAATLRGAPIDDALVLRDAGEASPEDVNIVGRRLAAAGVARWDIIENFVS
jgi:Mrp family chromosome partitioning ATPase